MNATVFNVGGVDYNVYDERVERVGNDMEQLYKKINYSGNPLPFLYKKDTYFNGSSEVALSGYDLYKVPLSLGRIVYVHCTDNSAFWDGLNGNYIAHVHYNNRYYTINGALEDNVLGGLSTSDKLGVLFYGYYAGADFCLFCVKRSSLDKTVVSINTPYTDFIHSGNAKYINTVTKIPNNDTIAIYTGVLLAKPSNSYIGKISYEHCDIRCLRVNKGDKLVFDSLATMFSYYGVFVGTASTFNINDPVFVAPTNGLCYLFYNDQDTTEKITLYPIQSIEIEYDHVLNKPGIDSKPLYGKTIAFFGDSITYNYIWEPYVLTDVGGTGVNCGIGSTPLSGTDENAFWQTTRLDAVKAADPDVVTILGGANDLTMNPVIGDDSNLADKDTDTFIGAYSYIINNLLTWKPSLKIIILSTTWAHNDGTDYSQTVTYGDFAAACKQVAEYYHLPYVDLYNESGFNAYTLNDSPYNIYSADHIHPNTAGAKIIAAMVIQKIREVFGVQ